MIPTIVPAPATALRSSPSNTIPSVEITTLYVLSAKDRDGRTYSHAFVTDTARCESRRRLSDDFVTVIDWELALPIDHQQVMLTHTDDGYWVQIVDEHDPLTDEPVIVAQAHRRGDGETLQDAREDSPLAMIFRIPSGVRMFGKDDEILDPAAESFVLAWMRYETDAAVLAALGFTEAPEVSMKRTRTIVEFCGQGPTQYDAVHGATFPQPHQFMFAFEHPEGLALTDRWLNEQALAYIETAGLGHETFSWSELAIGQGHPDFHSHLVAHGVCMLPVGAENEQPPAGVEWARLEMDDEVGVLFA